LPEAPGLEERVDVVKKHLKFSIEWKGEKTGIFEMRRHYTNYFKGIPDFKPFRMQLVSLENYDALIGVLEQIPERFHVDIRV
jgi:tRNA-dihydrouridine synthase